MNETPTPRTDEFWQTYVVPYTHQAKSFAEQLERELAEVTKQRDALAEALRVATAYPLTESWYKTAIEALATLKPCD